MKRLIADTINKIKKQHIRPEPRWKYVAKKYGLWVVFVVILVLTAISLSVAYGNANELDWDLFKYSHQGRIVYFLSIIPRLWVSLIVVFLVLAFFEIRQTETGYRWSRMKIFAVTAGGVLGLGILMTVFGFGSRLHHMMAGNFPYYGRHMMVTKESQWSRPEKGFLSGTIIAASSDRLLINDLDGQSWNVRIDENTLVRPAAKIAEGEMIKIIGERSDGNDFRATEIRPWIGRGMMGGGPGMMKGGPGRGMTRGNQ